MAVTRLSVPPSEFWRMEPDHFWWLVETLSPPPKQGLSKAEIKDLTAMLAEAEREHAEWQASAK
jgi:hypothetical protein